MNQNHAPLLMVVGALFLVANDALVKIFASELPTNQIIAIRAGVTALLCGVILQSKGWPLPSLRTRDLLIRTGFTIGNVFAFVAALVALPFSLAVFVDLTNILFVALFAPFVLAERLTIRQVIAVAIGILGAGILLSVEVTVVGWAILWPIASAIMGGGREVYTRKLGPDYSPVALTFYGAIGVIFAACSLGTGDWAFPSYEALFGVAVAGGLQGVAMLMITHAFQRGKASFVAPFRLTALLWAAILARVLFGETFTVMQVFGAVLICAALAAFTLTQGRQTNAP